MPARHMVALVSILAVVGPLAPDVEAAPHRSLEGMVHGAQIERWPEGASPSGTGFLVDRTGSVLVNAHTVAGCRQIHVLIPGAGRREAEILGIDARLDVALLKVGGLSGQPLPLAAGPIAAGARIEVLVLADEVGYAIDHIPGRVLKGTAGTGKDGLIEIAAALTAGQSGSPVISGGSLIGFVVGRMGDDPERGVVQPVAALGGFLRYFSTEADFQKRPDAYRLAARNLPIFQVNCN